MAEYLCVIAAKAREIAGAPLTHSHPVSRASALELDVIIRDLPVEERALDAGISDETAELIRGYGFLVAAGLEFQKRNSAAGRFFYRRDPERLGGGKRDFQR